MITIHLQVKIALLFALIGIPMIAIAHSSDSLSEKKRITIPELKYNFNKEGTNYIKATLLGQTWLRYSEMNSGTTIDGNPVSNYGDIGIRRWRVQAFGQLTDRIFIYTQFGQNNITTLQTKHTGAFIHDAVTEFSIFKELEIGTGLTAWNSFSRYSAAAVANTLSLDAPLYQQALNGVDDQFSRKLALYAKGTIYRLNYRIAIARPMSIKNSLTYIPPINEVSNFSLEAPKMQSTAYLSWQFFDKETAVVPYLPGTYLGKKKMLNFGIGTLLQKNAMWRTNEIGDTLRTNLFFFHLDLFADLPIGKNGSAITAYTAYSHYNFGKNYIRMLNGMNPSNGTNPTHASLNGTGLGFPMIGTGSILFTQVGYKLKDDLIKGNGTIMPYVDMQYGRFQALKNASVIYGAGLHWFIHGTQAAKLSLAYQNRPEFHANSLNEKIQTSRKSMILLQYQIFI